MVLLSGSEDRPMKSGNESGEKGCSDDDHDGIPLKQRLKKLRATKCIMDSGETKSEKEGINVSTPPIDFAVKEDDHCDSQGFNFACLVGESEVERLPPKGTHAGKLEYNSRETEANKCIALNQIRSPVVNSGIVRAEKLGPSDATSLQHAMPPKCIVKVKVECTDNTLMSSLRNCLTGSSSVDTQAIKIKPEVPDDFLDDLDNMVLKERQKMLLSRKSSGLTKPVLEVTNFPLLAW
ncbi:unnamed protein product [Ilex paraguariensis]|uniref:Uncharacterized protein n=1 Tax=Ilex paraguariensis TaxID=185542 RepID=A0ABC8SFY2_9AQUA